MRCGRIGPSISQRPEARASLANGIKDAHPSRGAKNITPIEGTPPKSRVTILQWESVEQYNAYRKSAAFADARKIGDKYGKFRTFAIEGMPQ
jgi:heme-degrading monooxygenase HmoA